MIKRKIVEEIDNWYKNEQIALLIDGARQVGKTTVIRNYFKDNNIDLFELNLIDNNDALIAFNTSRNAEQLLIRLRAIAGRTLSANTVIFIDEIQEAEDGITPIKFLIENSEYRFVFSGSLLGIKLKDINSMPLGSLKIIQMYPVSFKEYIEAQGVTQDIISYLKDCFDNLCPVDDIIHSQMMNLFSTYLIVGGMPKASQTFIDTKDISQVNTVLNDIDVGYQLDISKYDKKDKLLIEDIYNLIPSELNNQNKRFILKDLNKKSRYYEYEESFVWLKNSGVGLFAYNVDNPVYPLLSSKERTLFKLFLCDVGLLSYKLFDSNQITVLNGNMNINKGSLCEAFVAEELVANGHNLYFSNNKKRGEIDFLIEEENKIIPIEVKSGKDYKRHNSLNNLLNNSDYGIEKGYVLCNENIISKDKKIYIPIYMTMFLCKKKIVSSKIELDISALTKN